MNKRNLLLILCLSGVLLLSGCVGNVRLRERALVQALGMDLDGDGYKATMQLFDPSAPEGKPIILEARGQTLTSIFADAAVADGKHLFLGNLKAVLVGQAFARESMPELLSFLSDNSQLTPTMPLAMVRGRADDVIRGGEDNPTLQGQGIAATMQAAYLNGSAPQSRLMDLIWQDRARLLAVLELRDPLDQEQEAQEDGGLLDDMLEETRPAAAQAEAPTQNGQDRADSGQKAPPKYLVPSGSAVLQGGSLAGTLDLNTTRGACWLQSDRSSAVLQATLPDGGPAAAVSRQVRTRIHSEMLGDQPVFEIQIQVRLNLEEAALPPGEQLTPEQLHYLEVVFEGQIRAQAEAACTQLMRAGYDPFELDLRTRWNNRALYQAARDNWSDLLSVAGFPVTVDCMIDRMGATR